MIESDFAAALFTAVTGDAPPVVASWWESHRWEIEAVLHDGDPDRPLYETPPSPPVNGGGQVRKVVLHLHQGQMAAWNSEKRFTVMFAGTQGGKTSFLPWPYVRDIMIKSFDEGKRGAVYLAVTATYDLFSLKFLPMLLEIFVDVLGIGKYHAGARVIELINPNTGRFDAGNAADVNNMYGRIILRSASTSKSGKKGNTSDGGGLESATAESALLDECGQDGFHYNAWKAIMRRLSISQGRVYAGTTLYNLGWVKQVIYDPWERKETDDTEIIQFDSKMNPAFPDEEYERVKATMQKHEFDMLYRGIFGRPAGAIYDMFIDALRINGGHKVARFEIAIEWPRYQAVDPGVINAAKLWAAHDVQNDIYYVYREEHKGERLTALEQATNDLELEALNSERVVMRAIGAKSEEFWRTDYTKAGADGVKGPDTNNVEEGIDRVVTLLKQHRIYFFDDLLDVIEQILAYSRVINEFGETTNEIKDKETYHLVDALRYLAVLLVKPVFKKSVGKVRSYVGRN